MVFRTDWVVIPSLYNCLSEGLGYNPINMSWFMWRDWVIINNYVIVYGEGLGYKPIIM